MATVRGEPIRIVVVDDQALMREGLRHVFDVVPGLEFAGECADGDEVLATVSAVQPDIVVMDMRMRRVGGAAAIESLRQMVDHPPVLVLTTFDDPETVANAFDAGAAGFLLKESIGIHLVQAIQSVAGGTTWVDPAVTLPDGYGVP